MEKENVKEPQVIKERPATKKEEDLLERIKICNEYIRLWAEFFKPLSMELEDKVISPEEEKHFFRVIHALCFNHYKFMNAVGTLFKEGNDIIRLLSDIPSIELLKILSEAQLNKHQLDWHKIYLFMNKAEGKLINLIPLDSPIRKEVMAIISK